MFFYRDMTMNKDSINLSPTQKDFDSVTISNGIFDQLNILSLIDSATNVFDTTKPTQFTSQTIMNAMFYGNLDAGELGSLMTDLNHLEIQRREIESDEWLTLYKIYKNENNEIVSDFTMYDTINQNNTQYFYRVVPVDTSGNYGIAIEQKILSRFNNAYICDEKQVYTITNEYNLGSVARNQMSAVYTPLNSKYPFVAYNALTNYDSGSVTTILLSDTSKQSSRLDRKAQMQIVKDFNDWLVNGKAKILKDFNGNIKLIAVTEAVTNTYDKNLGNGLASITFNFTEIGEFTQKYLDNSLITNNFVFNAKSTSN